MQDINWHDLRYLLAANRENSFAGAARQLGVNETTVARRIVEMETKIGAQLLERTRSGLHPTEAGLIATQSAENVEIEIQKMCSTISGSDQIVAGLVRVTAVPLIVNRVLVPALPQLLSKYPQLKVELIAEAKDLSPTRRETDIALRFGKPGRESRAVFRQLGVLRYAVYQSLENPSPATSWIQYENRMNSLPQQRWIDQYLKKNKYPSPVMTASDAEAVIRGITAGLGRSLLPCAIADREPDLARVEEVEIDLSRELWLMVHTDLRYLARIKVVMKWLDFVITELAAR